MNNTYQTIGNFHAKGFVLAIVFCFASFALLSVQGQDNGAQAETSPAVENASENLGPIIDDETGALDSTIVTSTPTETAAPVRTPAPRQTVRPATASRPVEV